MLNLWTGNEVIDLVPSVHTVEPWRGMNNQTQFHQLIDQILKLISLGIQFDRSGRTTPSVSRFLSGSSLAVRSFKWEQLHVSLHQKDNCRVLQPTREEAECRSANNAIVERDLDAMFNDRSNNRELNSQLTMKKLAIVLFNLKIKEQHFLFCSK